MTTFDSPDENHYEIIVWKGENADNQRFLLSPQCFYRVSDKFNVLSNI